MKKILLFLLMIPFVISCGVDRCDYDCSEGAIYFKFVILKEGLDKNVFETGLYAPKNIQIFKDGVLVPHYWNAPKFQILLGPFDQAEIPKDYDFKIGQSHLFTLTFGVAELVEECCTNYEFSGIVIKPGTIEEKEGVYVITIPIE